jgi:hypothetical protein
LSRREELAFSSSGVTFSYIQHRTGLGKLHIYYASHPIIIILVLREYNWLLPPLLKYWFRFSYATTTLSRGSSATLLLLLVELFPKHTIVVVVVVEVRFNKGTLVLVVVVVVWAGFGGDPHLIDEHVDGSGDCLVTRDIDSIPAA